MKTTHLSALALVLCIASGHSQSNIAVSGHVTVTGGAPLQGATVWLMMSDKLATTDAAGYYSMSGMTRASAGARSVTPAQQARIERGVVVVELSKPQDVGVAIFDASGRQARQIFAGRLATGEHRIGLAGSSTAMGVRFVRVSTAEGISVLRLSAAGLSGSGSAQAPGVQARPLAKQTALGVDTIVFTALGYTQIIRSIDTLEGVFDAAMAAGTPTPALSGMRQLDSGTFMMGGLGTASPASPIHQVTVTGFYIDTTEVTQTRYMAVMGISPPVALGFSYDHLLPVEAVTWFDAALFCNRQSRIDNRDTVYSYTGLAGTPGYGCTNMTGLVVNHGRNGYRLPTEAQWEYACRANTTGNYFWGPADSAGAYAWYADNSSDMSHPVAEKRPNAFGLYDMSGNVWEWSNDWYSTYTAAAQVDPTGPATPGTQATRMVRGGSQDNDTTNITSHMRQMWFQPSFRYMTIGFRTVRPLN
jgi:formylglycine-generating enzyme required for sulfatase activity